MKTAKKHITFLLSLAVLALLLSLSLMLVPKQDEAANGLDIIKADYVTTVSDETATLVPGEDYIIIFSSDSNQLDGTIASELRSALRKSGQTLSMKSDSQQRETAYEILIGNTNRKLSEELAAACKATVRQNSLVWGFAYKDGKFAYAASDETAFARGQKELFERFVTEESHFVVPSDLWLIVSLSREDYEAEIKAEQDRIEAEKEQERLNRIEALKTEIANFSFSDFTDYVTLDFTVMPNSGAWGRPNLYPTAGEHPRLNVTKDTLEYIKEYLKTEEGELLYEGLLKEANKAYDGILGEATERDTGRIGYHNMSEGCLATIEARAFLYLLTGDEEWGYNAILTMKNFLKTIDIRWIHSDQCREFGRILFTLAEVYDWCHDLLTEDDKNQFMVAATDICASDIPAEYSGKCQSGDAQIEVGYPPSGQGSVNGHGSEAQILRDYLSVAIAIFDENPSWYEYVAARVYNDYIVTRNYFYTSGTYPQGINTYAPFRHNADIWSAWMLQCATGENPYIDMLEHITVSFFEHELPNGTYFGSGDGSRPTSVDSRMKYNAVLIAGLYGNTNMRQRVLDAWGNDLKAFGGGNVEMSFSSMLYFSASYWNKTGRHDGTPSHTGEDPVIYHGYPISQMMARGEWYNPDVPAVFMKIGEKSTANHDHADSGSFQIFYKGLYSGESGVYDKYGSTHFYYYHQSTVAHNSLLVFNPDLAVYELDGETVDSSSNFAKSFYSGGQRTRLNGGDNLESWLNNTSLITGTVIGNEYGLKDDGSADYAYLAGDITAAYQATQASHVGRRMFTLFTDDEKYPMYFIVYDQITATEDNFVKKFLLHTPQEPVIDEANKTVTITDNDGRLVLHTLKGGDKIEALGGEGRNYLINGIQCAGASTGSDKMWGRVEISNTGSLSSDFLSFMYVTDASNDEKLSPTMIETDTLSGIQLNKDIVIFAKSTDDRNTEELVFNTEGTGLNRHFVTGLFEGTWNIEVDGVSVGHRVSSEEGGMITFYAPAGEVHIKPGGNIAPSNGGRIIYNAYGGIVPDEAPLIYEIGVPVKLPETIKRGSDEFLGWYTSPYFEEETKVTEIIGTEKGKISVYARFRSFPVSEDYEGRDFKVLETNKDIGTLSYRAAGKTGSCFETVKDEESGNTYLRISHTEKDLELYATKPINDYLSSYTTLTFELDLAKDGDKTPIGSTFRLREQTYSKIAVILSTGTDGTVKLGGKTTIFTLSEEFQKAIITVNFAEGTMTAYNIFGDELATTSFSVPATSAAQDTLEWASILSCTFNWWIGTGGESFLVDNVKVYCGEYDAQSIELPEGEARIIYKPGLGTLPSGYPLTYKAGVPTVLPSPTVENGKFAGWYTTETFEPGTEISVIERDVAENITVYAKYALTFFDQDFTGASVNVMNESKTINGISYGLKDKGDSYAKSETDSLGNTYIKVYTNTMDATLNNSSDVAGAALSSGGKVTFTVDLATHEDGRVGWSQFRLRATSWSDILSIFVVDKNGVVHLGGEKGTPLFTLSQRFQKVAITLDIYEQTVTAYSLYGDVLGTESVSAPAETGYASVAEWISTVKYAFNWQFSKEGGLLIDNLLFYTGDYIKSGEEAPSDEVNISFNAGGGSMVGSSSGTYKIGDTLPTATNGNYTFGGWYPTPYFDGDMMSVVPEGAPKTLTLYAKWLGKVFSADFDGESLNTSYESDNQTVQNVLFGINGKTDATAKTATDENGNTYISFGKGTSDPYISKSGNISIVGGGKITFTVDIKSVPGAPVAPSRFDIRGNGNQQLKLFITDESGNISLVDNTGTEETYLSIGQVTDKFQKICVTLDVKTQTVTAYTYYGDVLGTVSVAVPAKSTAESFIDYIATTERIFYWYFRGDDGDLAFDNIEIYLGDFIPVPEVIPEGYTKVIYNTNGGVFAETPDRYIPADADYTLPTDITNGDAPFLGWFTSPAFEEASRITEIPLGTSETVKVYAAWSFTILDFNAEDVDINYDGKEDGTLGGVTGGGLSFQTKGQNSYIHTLTDQSGGKYVLWSKGTGDPQIMKSGNLANEAKGNKVISFTFSFAKEEGKDFVTSEIKMRTLSIYDNGQGSLTKAQLYLCNLKADGSLYLSNSSEPSAKIGQFGTDFKTLGVVADFNTGMVYGYNENGELVCESEMKTNLNIEDKNELYEAIAGDILDIYPPGTAETALRIQKISIKAGNIFIKN